MAAQARAAAPFVLLLAFSYLFLHTLAFTDSLCSKYGALTPVPGISGRDFCDSSGISEENMEKCMLLYVAGRAFTQSTGDLLSKLECSALLQVPAATLRTDGEYRAEC